MSTHFCAAVPNLAIMEFEGDDVPWKSSLLTVASEMRNGQFIIPTGVGWGADVDEKAVAAHPWGSGKIT
jgi:L-alanine-DL-glutamate epimerase-like enolase superfamily enzyme